MLFICDISCFMKIISLPLKVLHDYLMSANLVTCTAERNSGQKSSTMTAFHTHLCMFSRASATRVSGLRIWRLRLGWSNGRHRFHCVTQPTCMILGSPSLTAFIIPSSHCLIAWSRTWEINMNKLYLKNKFKTQLLISTKHW